MSFAILTVDTTLSATMKDLWSDPDGTHSFTFSAGVEEELFVLDDDATFNDMTGDANQVVAPASTIFLDNTPVGSRHKFDVTPNNGDPNFTVYVVFENTTTNDDFSPINTLNYALVSQTPLIAGLKYSISAQSGDGTVDYSSFKKLLLCFGGGTRIETDRGSIAVEDLNAGDMVWTVDHGFQPIKWINKTFHSWSKEPDKQKPILFQAGSLGAGLPHNDLIVSPQHRMLFPDTIEELGLLGPAKAMTCLKGVRQMNGCRQIVYYHLMLKQHEVIMAEGTLTESFYPGSWVMRCFSRSQRIEVTNVLASWPREKKTGDYLGARRFLNVKETRTHFETRKCCWSQNKLEPSICSTRSKHRGYPSKNEFSREKNELMEERPVLVH